MKTNQAERRQVFIAKHGVTGGTLESRAPAQAQGIWDERSKTFIKPSGTVKQGRRPMFKPNDASAQAQQCPSCGHAQDNPPKMNCEDCAWPLQALSAQAQHSPLPWQVISGSIYTESEIPVAHMVRNSPRTLPTERDANAAFIVRACNEYGKHAEWQKVAIRLKAALDLANSQRDEVKRNTQRLADDMREIRDMAKNRSRVNMQNGVSLAAFAACSLAQWEGGAQ